MNKRYELVLMSILLCACSTPGPNPPPKDVATTPDLAATVSAAVRATSDFNAAVLVALKATELAAPTSTPMPSPTPQPTQTPVRTATPLPPPTGTPASVAPQPVAPAAPSGFSAKVTIQKAGYERWGRPQGMVDPNWRGERCTGDDRYPVLKLGISLALTNTGSQEWPAGTRSVDFYKSDGTKAFTCLYDYLSAYPPTKPGQEFQMSYLAFVQLNERVAYGIFTVTDVGKQRFEVPTNLPVP